MAANADRSRRHFDVKDTKFDRIMKDILSDADRVIRNAMTELDLDTITATDGESHDEIVDYLQDKLRECYPSNRKLRQLVTSIVAESDVVDQALTERDDDVTTMRSMTESLPYQVLETKIKEAIDNATDQLVQDTHWLTLNNTNCAGQFADSQWSLSSVSTSPTSNYDTSSLASSYGATYWEMLNGDRLNELADHLDERHPWPQRRDTLRTLSSLPMAEVVGFDEWPKLRAKLRSMLLSCDAEPFRYGVRFHVKMLRSTSSQCVVESYVNLVETLYAFYESGYSCVCDKCRAAAIHSRIDTIKCDDRQTQVLQLSKLVNTFQKVIPQYWTRYSESQIQKIVEHTIRYLMDVDVPFDNNVCANSIDDGFYRILTPLHVLAAVDPRADWFDAWICGDHGKRIVIHELSRHNDVLPRLVTCCLTAFDYLEKNANVKHSSKLFQCSLAQSAYVCLIHVIRILGHVLRNVQGRTLFDTQLEAKNGLQFCDFLCSVLNAAFVASRSTNICNEFCLARVAIEVFKSLIAYETSCGNCFEDGKILNVALGFVRFFVESNGVNSSDFHLLNHLTSFLSHLADSCVGLQIILKFQLQQQEQHQSATELVTLFVERLLMVHEDFVPSLRETVETMRTKSVGICCRLLADHKGIVMLKSTGVLYKIAEEWEARLREFDQTPVMGETASDRQQFTESINDWLKELIAVGRTPIGMLSLYKTDLLQDILNYVENKFSNNKRMKSMENTTMMFLSQAASLCCECPQLTANLTPIVNQVAMTIWSASELGSIRSDNDIIPIAEESLTLITNRLLADLVCILPSSESIHDLRGQKALEGSDCSQSYLVKLVMSAIQNWYQRSELTCGIGIRLLSLLGSDLNNWLYLESNFNFQEMLLEAQVTDDHEDPIIDQNSLFRNHLLVKMTEIGGENEKRLPPQSEDFDTEYSREWPLVTSLPIPREYLLTLSTVLSSPPSEIKFFLKESHSESLDAEWLVYCREVFRNCLTDENVKLRGKWFGDLLYLATEAFFRTAKIVPISSKESSEVSFDNNLGCQLVVSYGLRLGLLEDGVKSVYDLLQVLSLLQDTKTSKDFDWLTATVFLLTNGEVERTTTFVSQLQRLPQGQQLSNRLASADRSDNGWTVFCHNIEVVLRGDLPLVANALVRSGMSVGQICQPWIAQCFWNVLDWEEICTYVGLCVLMGADYQVYYVVALFRHLQKEILRHVALDDFPLFVRETRLEGYCTRDNLPFIDHLESKYRGILLQKSTA